MTAVEREEGLATPGRLDYQIARLQREVFLLRRHLANFFRKSDCGWEVPKEDDLVVKFDFGKAAAPDEQAMTDEEYATYRKRQVERDTNVWYAALGLTRTEE